MIFNRGRTIVGESQRQLSTHLPRSDELMCTPVHKTPRRTPRETRANPNSARPGDEQLTYGPPLHARSAALGSVRELTPLKLLFFCDIVCLETCYYVDRILCLVCDMNIHTYCL